MLDKNTSKPKIIHLIFQLLVFFFNLDYTITKIGLNKNQLNGFVLKTGNDF
jgi:hypothetical protein